MKLTPQTDWLPGLHKLQVTAADATGNKTTRLIFLNYAPGEVHKQWLANGGIAIGGKPQFLLGMYGVRLEDMPELAKAGYDYVHNYTWDGAGTNESAIAYLDACAKYGLQAFHRLRPLQAAGLGRRVRGGARGRPVAPSGAAGLVPLRRAGPAPSVRAPGPTAGALPTDPHPRPLPPRNRHGRPGQLHAPLPR